MQCTYLSFIYIFCLFIPISQQNESVLSFDPSSISFAIGDTQSVDVSLLQTNLTYPIIVEFLYDGKQGNSSHYIDVIPNIIFTNHSEDKQTKVIAITGRHQGHIVITATSSQVNISTDTDFILIDIARNKILTIFVQIVGWIYFAAWSISFYPQIILNFQRRSVIGLNFDFIALNILGHSCYAVFNLYLYTSKSVQQEYFDSHPHGVLPVLLNDVIFSCHAVFACLVTIIQCFCFQRENQRVSLVARIIGSIMIIFLFVSTIVCLSKHLSTLGLLYYFSYVKLAITIIKYCPQAWMNFRRKSTEGWSIGNILLDLTGGLFSLLQMFFLAINYDDWSSIFGSPTKLGLALFTIIFDLLFIVQHYILYRTRTGHHSQINSATIDVNEHSPILPRKS